MLPLFVGLVLDTSALTYIAEQRVDIGQLYEHEVFMLAAVVEELRLLELMRELRRAYD
jgi:rRNA-processing protein FCF1